MKILFIAPMPMPVTGQSLACKLLHDDLLTDGHDVEVVNLSKGNLQNGASSAIRMLEIFQIICKVIVRRHGCGKIYFNTSESVAGNLKDLLIFLVLTGKLDVTYIHLHGGAGMRLLLSAQHPFLSMMNRIFLRQLAGIIVLGARHTSIYLGFARAGTTRVVENFAPDALFVGQEFLEQKLVKNTTIRILYLSNLLPGKGYKELVSAISLLTDDVRSSAQFEFAGGFESEEDKAEFLQSIRGFNNIQYHGSVHGQAKADLLMQADIFCLPTYYPFEGQPISILEAYAAGCAVVTTDHSGIFDIFTPGKNGVEVLARSPSSIAEALASLINDRNLLRLYGRINADEAKEKFRPRHHLSKLKKSLDLQEK